MTLNSAIGMSQMRATPAVPLRPKRRYRYATWPQTPLLVCHKSRYPYATNAPPPPLSPRTALSVCLMAPNAAIGMPHILPPSLLPPKRHCRYATQARHPHPYPPPPPKRRYQYGHFPPPLATSPANADISISQPVICVKANATTGMPHSPKRRFQRARHAPLPAPPKKHRHRYAMTALNASNFM